MCAMRLCFAPLKELVLSADNEESVVFPVLADKLSVPLDVAAVIGVVAVLVSIASCALSVLAKYAPFLAPVVGLAAAAYVAFFPVVVVLPTPVPLPLLFPPLPLPEYKEAKEDADFSDAEFSDFYNFSDDVEFSGITKKEAATEDPNQTVISETWIG